MLRNRGRGRIQVSQLRGWLETFELRCYTHEQRYYIDFVRWKFDFQYLRVELADRGSSGLPEVQGTVQQRLEVLTMLHSIDPELVGIVEMWLDHSQRRPIIEWMLLVSVPG